MVMQYNKRDLVSQGIPLLAVDRLERDLNAQLRVPSFEASAVTGSNVVATLKRSISLTIGTLQKKLR
jgi:hypothetical protein